MNSVAVIFIVIVLGSAAFSFLRAGFADNTEKSRPWILTGVFQLILALIIFVVSNALPGMAS